MKVLMDRMSFEIIVSGIAPETPVTLTLGKKEMPTEADEEGKAYFDCKKLIPGNLRSEAFLKVEEEGKNVVEHVYEVRMTKLVPKKIIEVRKEG